jgi:dCTP deaminase
MSDHILLETVRGLLEAEEEKTARVLERGVREPLRQICLHLRSYLDAQRNAKWCGLRDLNVLLHEVTAVSYFVDLVAAAAADHSSWWASSLIQECYERLGLDDTREVMIVHNDAIRDFCVHPNLLGILPRRMLPGEHPVIDLYEIPLAARHDVAAIAVIGHEAGHIYFDLNEDTLLAPLEGHPAWKAGPDQLDLFSANGDRRKRLTAHLTEHICDAIGRHLLGPAFDIALIKTLVPHAGGDRPNSTHPPVKDRILESLESIKGFRDATSSAVASSLDNVFSGWQPLTKDLRPATDADAELVRTLASVVIQAAIFPKPLPPGNLSDAWDLVSPELVAFRPPFEPVSDARPRPITPLQAVAVATLYYYGEHYKEKDGSDYFEYAETGGGDSGHKGALLRQRLVDHLVYMVGLYGFVRRAHARQSAADFETGARLQQSPLWKMRVAKARDRLNPLVVTPSIDPAVQYGQNAVDLRLGPFFLVHRPPRYTHMSPEPEGTTDTPLRAFYEEVALPTGQRFILHPHQFVLASTLEYVSLPYDHYALVLGRSTWGRLGLNIATATTVQAGFRGCLTLELRNLGETPLPLTVGTRIAQLCLVPVPKGSANEGYYASGGKYVGPVRPEIPRIRDDPDWGLFETLGS